VIELTFKAGDFLLALFDRAECAPEAFLPTSQRGAFMRQAFTQLLRSALAPRIG
jgi:hypothetical protein